MAQLLPVIVNARLAHDERNNRKTTSFSPDEKTFYCFFNLRNAPSGAVMTGVWILVSAPGFEPNSQIGAADLIRSDGQHFFKLDRSPSVSAWPVGKYRLDLYLDGTQAESLSFEVR